MEQTERDRGLINVKNRLIRKIKSRAGESLAEVLIAVLIIAVSAMLLAGMISSTLSIVTRSEAAYEEYYQENEKLETFSSSTPSTVTTSTVIIEITGSDDSEGGYKIAPIDVNCAKNERISSHTVVSYMVQPD